MKTHNVKCLVGSEPGEVRATTINVGIVDGRLQTGFFLGGHQISEGAELAVVTTERIRGWGRRDDNGTSYALKSVWDQTLEVVVPDHEFDRIGFDPSALRDYNKFEMQYKLPPVYHADGVPTV